MSEWVALLEFLSDEEMTQRGENGMTEFTSRGVGEPRVALFFALVRDLPKDRLSTLLLECFQSIRDLCEEGCTADALTMLADLFVLTFQTRDCRGGKGERNLFYCLLFELFQVFPQTVTVLLPLILTYGYFKDFVQLLEYLEEVDTPVAKNMQQSILHVMRAELHADMAKVDAGEIALSLCVKYLPREGKAFAKKHKNLFSQWIQMLYPHMQLTQALMEYRRTMANLTPCLDLVEVKMCGKRFAEIDFDHVPSVASKKYRRAFLNENMRGKIRSAEEDITGNRHPYDPDRVECRKHIVQRIKEGKVKGRQLFPHEMVRDLMKGGRCVSSREAEMLHVQWNDMRAHLISSLQNKRASGDTPAIDLGKLVPMVDVSGSMCAIPMEVAIALGILVSEVNHPAFRDRIITFEKEPSWVKLKSDMHLQEKVTTLRRAPWGGSTNLEAAMDLIARVVEANRLSPEDIPDLIVFSDMQFDTATCPEVINRSGKLDKRQRGQQTQLQRIQHRFHVLGKRLRGSPYPAPRIIFWNLRGTTSGFPAQANNENVQMLSGFSPALLKFVVEGVASGGNMGAERQVNPYLSLRKILDDERYNPVRMLLSTSQEGPLARYQFTSTTPT